MRVSAQTGPGRTAPSVALELQADCYAGVWGHDASQSGRFQVGKVELEPGDAEEALRAAASIGDDRLQRMSTGRVAPDRFTHGTSAQRMEWFQRGMQIGRSAALRDVRLTDSVILQHRVSGVLWPVCVLGVLRILCALYV